MPSVSIRGSFKRGPVGKSPMSGALRRFVLNVSNLHPRALLWRVPPRYLAAMPGRAVFRRLGVFDVIPTGLSFAEYHMAG